jgi:hypothetical protein
MGDGFATRPATNRLSLRRINAEPGSDFRGLIPESVKLLVVQITAKHLSAKHWLAAVRFALAHACSSQDNQLFPSAIDGVHPAYSRSPAPLVGAIASPRALRIGLCRATSCAFGIDLGSSLTRPLQFIFRQRETNSRFPARRSVCARRLHFPFSTSYLLLFLECATVPSRPGTPLTDNGPKIAARSRTKLAGARIGCP